MELTTKNSRVVAIAVKGGFQYVLITPNERIILRKFSTNFYTKALHYENPETVVAHLKNYWSFGNGKPKSCTGKITEYKVE